MQTILWLHKSQYNSCITQYNSWGLVTCSFLLMNSSTREERAQNEEKWSTEEQLEQFGQVFEDMF